MKKIYSSVLILFLINSIGIAQDDCCTAFPLGGNGAVFIPSSAGNGNFEDLSSCSCLSTNEHDSFWFSFECTSSGTFEMMITPENLSADFDFAVYSGGCPCDVVTVVHSCDYTGPINPPGPFVPTGISSNPMATFGVPGTTEFQPTISLTQGTTYWIIADNITSNGAGFDIEFAGTAGMGPAPSTGPPPPPVPLLGEFAPCPGVPFNYNVPLNSEFSEYEWTIDPSGPAVSGNSNSVDITWDEPGVYTLCVIGKNSCFESPPTCEVIVVTEIMGPLVNDIICLDDTYEAPDGQTFYDPGLYEMVFTSSLGCDSIVPLLLDLALTQITIFVEEICDGDCVQFAGETLCQTGIYEEVYETYQGCDSTVTLNLIVVPNQAVITGGGSISCNGNSVILDGTGSIGGSNMTYEWTDENGDVVGNAPILEVTVPGDYTLTISSTVGMNTCTDSEVATVDAANDPPENITATGGTITCTLSSITLMGNSSTPNVTYEWSGPGGFTSNEQNPTASAVGIYTLTVTGPNGCTGVETAEIDGDSDIPDAMATGGTLDCGNADVMLMGSSNTAGVTYAWTGPGFTSNEQNPTVSTVGNYTLTVTAPNGCSAQATTLVDEDSTPPDATADGGSIDCVNTTVMISGNSTTPNVTYAWTGPNFTSNEQNPTVNAGGTYTLTVTGPNGCTATATAIVDQDADLPTATATGGMVDCSNPMLMLTGDSNTPGVTFSWTGPNFTSNEQNPTVTEPGTYTLTVTSANGCSGTATAEVTQDVAVPDAAATGDTVTCATGSVVLNGSSTTPNVTYSWVGPGGNIFNQQNPTVSQIGIYTLTVTAENGCTSTTTAEVLQDAGVPDVAATGGTLDCNTNAITITGNSNTAGVTYSWAGPGGFVSDQTSATVDVSGEYILTVTAPNDCTAQATAVVVLNDALPVFSVEGGVLTCDFPQIALNSDVTTPGATIEWNGPNGFVSDQPDPTVSEAGDYVLTVTAPNGCSDQATAVVGEDVAVPDITASGGTFNCTIPTVTLQGGSATPGVSFEWTGPNGFMTDLLDTAVAEVGDYTLTVTAPNGCTATEVVTVDADTDPPTGVNATGGILSCATGVLTLTGESTTPNAQYSWSGPAGFTSDEQNPAVSQPGSYLLTVTGPNGCVASDQAVVGQDANAPQIAAAGATLSCNEPTVQISGSSTTQGASYAWTGPGGFVSNMQNPMVSAAGDYVLTVTAPNGCESEATATVAADLDEPENVTATGGTLTCLAGTLEISGSSTSTNVTYAWTGPGGFVADQATADVTVAGDYVLTVTGENGCTATATAVVENDSNAPTATAEDGEITCDEPTVSLNGQSNTGVDFSWTGPNGFQSDLPDPAVDQEGVYTLVVTAANGCTAAVDAVVTLNNAPPDVAAAGGLITCQEPTVVLTGSSATQGVLYSWSGPGGFSSDQPTPPVSVGGDYVLTVTATNGCTASATATVTVDADVPTAFAEGGTITCLVPQIQLSGDADQMVTSWAWTGPGGFTSSEQSPDNITLPGTYTLTITTGNGCSASANALVESNIELPTVVINPAGVLTCDVETITLDAAGSDSGPDFQITWTTTNGNFVNGQNTLTPVVNEAGTYVLEITNQSSGCENQATITVDASADTPSGIDLIVNDDFCFGSSGNVVIGNVTGGVSPYLYSLNGGPFSSETLLSNLPPGDYQLTVQDLNGCEYTESFVIDQPVELTVGLNTVGIGSTPVPLGDAVDLVASLNIPAAAVASIVWTPEGVDAGCSPPCLDLTVVPEQTTTYTVTVVDSSGCFASAELLVLVDKSRPVFVPNGFSPNNDGINDLLVLFGGKSVVDVKSFLIFSRWGETVFEVYNFPHSDFNFGWDGTYRGKILDTGVYTWFAEVEFVDGEILMFEGDVTLIR